MAPDLLQPATSLGVAGFAILVMWWMYKDSAGRLDKKEDALHALEKEVRTEITTQLIASTTTIRDNLKIMEHLVQKLKIK